MSHHTQPFCSLAAVLYGELAGVQVVTDCHNGPFADPVWQMAPLRAINKFVFRRAAANLVHNEAIRRYAVDTLNLPGRFLVLHDVVPESRGSASWPRRPAASSTR